MEETQLFLEIPKKAERGPERYPYISPWTPEGKRAWEIWFLATWSGTGNSQEWI